MKNQINLLTLALLFLFACSGKNQSTGELKIINVLESEKRELNISEIADDIIYLPLANDSLLATIRNVVFNSGEYFVVDRNYKFIRFDENGNFLNQIGNRGAGPGEYRSIMKGIMINPNSNEVFIPGGKDNQVMVYSPEGKYVRSFDLPTRILTTIETNGENILAFFYNWAEYDTINMKLLDTNGTILKNYKNKYYFERGQELINLAGNECLMYQFNNLLHLKEASSDTLFYLEDNQLVPKMILNSGERGLTPENRTKIRNEFNLKTFDLGETLNKTLIQNDLFETDNYLFYSYGYENSTRTLVYNKSTNKAVEFNYLDGIINDWDGGPNIFLKLNKDDNTLLSWMDAFELKEYVASDAFKNATPKYPEKKKQLEELANSLDENDNPVLMLVKLKE